jgi:hypothetical protein
VNCSPKGKYSPSSRNSGLYALSVLFLVLFPPALLGQSQQLQWVPQGASPNLKGQVENIDGQEVTGGIQSVAINPTDPNTIYVGAVNGGIWKSVNAMTSPPVWTQLTDVEDSLSIGAIAFDPTDGKQQTVVAGIGRFSSMSRVGGTRSGLLRTTDGGLHWSHVTALQGLNISGVAPRGRTIVVSANAADDPKKVGIWRISDTQWIKISGAVGSGLPSGACSSLASDPSAPERLYTNAWTSGIFRSDSSGATWSKVSSTEMDVAIARADNVKISVGNSGHVYVAIDVAGHLASVFHSPDGRSNWTAMGLPAPEEGGIHPGGQGGIHLAIAADPVHPDIVYIGGDRQPAKFVNGVETGQSSDDPPQWPNSIGAYDFTGRLFRGDSSKPVANQWVHLTHSRNLGPKNGGTANSSAPHADSRDLEVAPNGMLINVNDGGIYGRSEPLTNSGNWFSMNGNLQLAEFHSVVWDSNSHTIVAGAQDTGSPEQETPSDTRWESVSTGDGGVVAVDTISSPGQSVRYTSYYQLGQFRRQIYDASNSLQSQDYPALTVLNGGTALDPQFYTPIRLNAVNPMRIVVGANSVYESSDQGETITEIGPGIVVNANGENPIAYGARDNPDILYVGSHATLYVRRGADPSPLTESSTYRGGNVVGITLDPDHGQIAYVASPNRVYQTVNGGDTWKDITGDLPIKRLGNLRSISYSTAESAGLLIVGGDRGVYRTNGPAFSSWSQLGAGLPNAPVYHLEYSPTDRLELAGTLGRGAWTLRFPPSAAADLNISAKAQFETVAFRAPSEQADSTAPPAVSASQLESVQKRFQLATGVVIDPAHNQLYATDVEGGMKAIDAATGRVVWRSRDAAKPIGFSGDWVVVQLASGNESTLKLGSLEWKTGRQVASVSAPLPPQIVPSIVPNLKGSFSVIADNLPNGDALVSWQYVPRTPRALPPGTDANLPPVAGLTVPPSVPQKKPARGAVRFNPKTGAWQELDAKDAAPTQQQTAAWRSGSNRQFLSVDGRNFLLSALNKDNSDAQKYTLTVYDRQTGTRLGQFKSSLATVPFYVSDSKAIYEIGPSIKRISTGLTELPRRIEAVDLTTGHEVWTASIRDETYRGSYPP